MELKIRTQLPACEPGPEWTGIYRISNETYHHTQGLSKTTLAKIAESPLQYHYSLTHKEESTDSKDLGDAVHAYVLEPERFYTDFCAVPNGMIRNIKHQKYKDFLEENQGKIALKQFDHKNAQVVGKRARNHPYFSKALKGYHELSLFYWDEERQILLKTRPDILNLAKRAVVDLKTTYEASPRLFTNTVHQFSYNMSVALSEDITRAIFGEAFSYTFALIQSKPPFDIALYDLPGDWVDNARQVMYQAIEAYKELSKTTFEVFQADKGIQTLIPRAYMYAQL